MAQAILFKLFDVRRGEGLRVFLMFAYIFLVIAALIILKPVSKSLLLTQLGIEQLPVVLTLVALFSGLFTLAYLRLIRNVRPNRFIHWTLAASAVSLAVFGLLLRRGFYAPWFVYAFFIWVAIFGVITSSQFWFLANYVFNAREAKRLFGLIGAGAISGGICGGYLTRLIAPALGSDNLVFVCCALICLCIVIFRTIWIKSARFGYRERIQQQKRLRRGEARDNPIKLIAGSRLLIYLAGIVGIGVLVANIVDYQYSAIAAGLIRDEDALTAFFGFWLSTLSIASLLVQLLFTSRILKRFGVGASLFFLPVGILIGAAAIIISPALWSAILIKVSDGSLKQSIQKAGVELLNLPVPARIKSQVKQFIDVFIDNIATGLAGILLIILTLWLSASVAVVSLIVIILVAAWLVLTVRARDEYVNAFRKAIEQRTIELDEQTVNLQDKAVLDSLMHALQGRSEKQILYVLDLIENVRDDRFVPVFRSLIAHPSAEIKVKVFKVMYHYDKEDFIFEASELVEHENQAVRVEALRHLCRHSIDRITTLDRFLRHEDLEVRGSALLCAAYESRDDAAFSHTIGLDTLVTDIQHAAAAGGSPRQIRMIKTNVAEAIGVANHPNLYPMLKDMLEDADGDVVRAAIVNAGKTRAEMFVPDLIDRLQSREYRMHARQALADYGEAIVAPLVSRLNAGHPSRDAGVEMTRVLSLIGSQKAVDGLNDRMADADASLRFHLIRALNRLKSKYPLLQFDQRTVREHISAEIAYRGQLMAVLEQLTVQTAGVTGNGTGAARDLLLTALQESVANSLERLFRLLGLVYTSDDIFNAYLGIVSQVPSSRANAIEFLDNLLDSELKKYIIPIVESELVPPNPDLYPEEGPEVRDMGLDSAFAWLLENGNSWLQTCTIHFLRKSRNKEYLTRVAGLAGSDDPRVSEEAGLAMQTLGTV